MLFYITLSHSYVYLLCAIYGNKFYLLIVFICYYYCYHFIFLNNKRDIAIAFLFVHPVEIIVTYHRQPKCSMVEKDVQHKMVSKQVVHFGFILVWEIGGGSRQKKTYMHSSYGSKLIWHGSWHFNLIFKFLGWKFYKERGIVTPWFW